MLEEIKRRVEEKVNQSNPQIIMGMYQNMVKSHKDLNGCDCNYCRLLRKYVQAKLDMSRYIRYMNSHEFDYYNNPDIVRYETRLSEMKREIKNLKCAKDKLKKFA